MDQVHHGQDHGELYGLQPLAPGCSWVDFALLVINTNLKAFEPINGIIGPIEMGDKSRNLFLNVGVASEKPTFGEL